MPHVLSVIDGLETIQVDIADKLPSRTVREHRTRGLGQMVLDDSKLLGSLADEIIEVRDEYDELTPDLDSAPLRVEVINDSGTIKVRCYVAAESGQSRWVRSTTAVHGVNWCKEGDWRGQRAFRGDKHWRDWWKHGTVGRGGSGRAVGRFALGDGG